MDSHIPSHSCSASTQMLEVISFDCQKSGILSKTGYLRAPYFYKIIFLSNVKLYAGKCLYRVYLFQRVGAVCGNPTLRATTLSDKTNTLQLLLEIYTNNTVIYQEVNYPNTLGWAGVWITEKL